MCLYYYDPFIFIDLLIVSVEIIRKNSNYYDVFAIDLCIQLSRLLTQLPAPVLPNDLLLGPHIYWGGDNFKTILSPL